jgi:hypothetical protein
MLSMLLGRLTTLFASPLSGSQPSAIIESCRIVNTPGLRKHLQTFQSLPSLNGLGR